MNRIISVGLAALLCASLGHAVAEEAGRVSRAIRVIDPQVQRVRLEGVVELRVRQGASASLVMSGDPRIVDQVSAVQHGDLLTIDADGGGRERGPGFSVYHVLRAELTLPQLREVVSDSLGATEVTGFTGEQLVLGLEGAGPMKVVCNYRFVQATLDGLGSMNIQNGNGEGVDLNLLGAGFVTLTGQTRWLKARLSGLGGMDAQQLHADSVTIDLGGLGSASVFARQSAAISLGGLGSVAVYGKPATRNVNVDGLGKVSWK